MDKEEIKKNFSKRNSKAAEIYLMRDEKKILKECGIKIDKREKTPWQLAEERRKKNAANYQRNK